jgi:hypothetical protein
MKKKRRHDFDHFMCTKLLYVLYQLGVGPAGNIRPGDLCVAHSLKKKKLKRDIKFGRAKFSFKPYLVWQKNFKEFGWLGFELMVRKI